MRNVEAGLRWINGAKRYMVWLDGSLHSVFVDRRKRDRVYNELMWGNAVDVSPQGLDIQEGG